MKLSFNLLFQLAALTVQFGNMASGYLPPKYQATLLLVVGIAQAVVSYRAHKFNPDGTPAEKPYDKTGDGFYLPRKNGGDDGLLG